MRYARVTVLAVDGGIEEVGDATYQIRPSGELVVTNEAMVATWATGRWLRVTAVREANR